jgi:pSer/pThr/pTyr-binding forkhead associated (FHA) protein
MAFRLVIQHEIPGDVPRSAVVTGHRAAIGRAKECDVQLDEVGISHHHATIFHCGRSFLVVDEGSANGTFVGDAPLAPRSARLVLPGQSFRVGRARIEVLNEDRTAPAPNATTRELALAMVQEMTSGTQGKRATPWIAVTSGPDAGKALLLGDEDKPYLIGRGSSVDLPLEDERVSRRHLSIVRRGRDVFIAGLAQNHRASLGDQALVEALELRWLPGTPLTIAQSVFGLFDPSHELKEKLAPTPVGSRAVTEHSGAKRTSAPIATVPGSAASPSGLPAPSSPSLERTPARRPWSSMDTTIVIIASIAIASAAAILVWLFVPWST